jgi:adenylate cyclase
MWGEVTNTDRLNRSAGMAPLTLVPLSDRTAARYLARTILGGFAVDFEEPPFEFRQFEVFESIRKMRSGPALEVRTRFVFTPTQDGSKVDLRVSIVPRLALLRPVVWLAAGRTIASLVRAIQQMDQGLAASDPAVQRTANPEALARAKGSLHASDPEVVDRLLRYVDETNDGRLARIRPYELAVLWALDRTVVLTTCLEAVSAGLLDLKWDIICPSCRTAASRVPKLAELPAAGHCQLCELDFAMDLDRAVEATFSPHPSVREVDDGPYCIGGPARTPHVYVQALLPRNGKAALAVPKEPGRYKLFVRGGAGATIEVLADAAPAVDVVASAEIAPKDIRVAPGGTVTVDNQSESDRHAKIERLEWLNLSATAHEVSLLGAFRRLFSADVLTTGTVLRVARVGLLFTDLTASTALYTRAGDASAYRLVHEHFELLGAIIEKNHGTVVKTMGDAVMAAFSDELAGFDAATEMLEAFYRFRHGRDLCEEVFLKLGYHAGASYVVNANHALDYFGQTVNIAARLQARAESSELVTEMDLAQRARREGRLSRLAMVQQFDATLKGLSGPLQCARLRLGADVARSVRPPADVARSIPSPAGWKSE